MFNEMCMTTGLILNSLTRYSFHCMWEISHEEEDRIKCQEIYKTKTYCMFGLIILADAPNPQRSIASRKCTVSCGGSCRLIGREMTQSFGSQALSQP